LKRDRIQHTRALFAADCSECAHRSTCRRAFAWLVRAW
jgi:hypothetical protein